MLRWLKETANSGNGRLILSEPVIDNRAKRETARLLHHVCRACIYLQEGGYGMLEVGGSVGERERIPYRICPGIGKPEAKC